MILEEVIVLTRTVPEESKKYGRRVCLAAYCKDFKLTDAVDGILDVGTTMHSRDVRRMLSARYPTSDSIAALNERRASLGIVHAVCKGHFKSKSTGPSQDPSQLMFWDDMLCFDNREHVAPYISFDNHTLQMREWGCHEWLRKRPDEAAELWTNLRLDRLQMLVVGNMMHRRSIWMVLKSYAMEAAPLFT